MASKEGFWKNYRAMRKEEKSGGSMWTVVESIFNARAASPLGEQSE